MEKEALRCPSAVVALSEVDRKTLKALATRELDVEVGLGYMSYMPRHGIPVCGIETLVGKDAMNIYESGKVRTVESKESFI